MKKLAILFIAIFTVGLVSAQSPIFEKEIILLTLVPE